ARCSRTRQTTRPARASTRSRPTRTDRHLYFGPAGTAPAGLEANWIETFPGKGFYPMFRIYYPKAGLFDGTWKLADVELVKYGRTDRSTAISIHIRTVLIGAAKK